MLDINKVIEVYGTTQDVREAGYILTNGNYLDLSEKNNGGTPHTRNADHRDINQCFESENMGNTEALINFMNDGNIRLLPESGGIDLSIKPNSKQKMALRDYINYFNGDILIEIDNENGKQIFSKQYSKKTASSKILNDIENYFNK